VLIVAPEVGADDRWRQVAIGSDHTCALRTDDTLWCWGGDAFGQLGQGTDPYVRERPNPVPGGAKWRDLDSGNDYSCAIRDDGTLWCWGLNDIYQLGLGDTMNRSSPVQVMPGTFAAVGVGPSSGCAVTDSGEAWCWGGNVGGETGGTPGTPTMLPTPIAGTWIGVKGGASFTCFMAPNEDVYCMGNGANGRLGDGTGFSSLTPVRVMF
jgi:alpha-tubulin suppressor-like RCC1 family protein